MGFYGGLGGVSAMYDTSDQEWTFVDRRGHKLPLIIPTVDARLKWKAPIHADEFRFLSSLTSRTPKITIPSPTILHLRAGREHISREAYPDLELFWEDVVDAFRNELAALYQAGCRYVQIDETTLASLSDTSSWRYLERRGDDGRRLLLETYPAIMNAAFAGRPAGFASRDAYLPRQQPESLERRGRL